MRQGFPERQPRGLDISEGTRVPRPQAPGRRAKSREGDITYTPHFSQRWHRVKAEAQRRPSVLPGGGGRRGEVRAWQPGQLREEHETACVAGRPGHPCSSVSEWKVGTMRGAAEEGDEWK